MRIHKWLSKTGFCSLRKAEELISQGKVFVDGKQATLGQDIDENSKITVDGKLLSNIEAPLQYFMLYKPTGILSSHSPEDNKPCLNDLESVKSLGIKLSSVGRLDYFSEGLLILTNDGPLCNQLMHPRYEVKKVYQITSNQPLPAQAVTELKHGIELEDGPASASVVTVKDCVYEITISIGRNRILRRIFEHYGLHVKKLVRLSVGSLKLDPRLKPGQIRALTADELKKLKE